jgi:isoleucyl-tRNA synthetase
MEANDAFNAFRDDILESLDCEQTLRFWDEIDLLAQLRQKNKGRQKQVIHDVPRPPLETVTPADFSHRILKDIYFKVSALMGYNVTYQPSWNLFDPAVESDVVQSEHKAGNVMDAVRVRRQCRSRVAKRMEYEKSVLQRLGIFADWRGIRSHLESRYEARLLDGFGLLMERGYLAKEAKPSYWCVNCQTILTPEELRFKLRKSAAAYVRFPVRRGLERLGSDVALLVWVVELWALPAGIAIALPKTGEYVVVEYDGRTLIVESATAQRVLGESDARELGRLDTLELLQCTCSHPLLNVELPVVVSEVQNGSRKASGLFLAVPGHNQDDYAVRLEHNFKIVSIIDDEGRLTEDAERFCGLNVFEASEHIALQLDNLGCLVHADTVETPYPHCWTCEMPAIFRPADQWLFDSRRHRLAERSLRELEAIESGPGGHRALTERIASKSKFGVSRQRVWGLPVPAFYCRKCGTQLEVDRGVKAVRDLISHKSTDAWFRTKADVILSSDISCSHCGEREFRKDTSILDSRMVAALAALLGMDGRRESSAVGDIYLEQDEETFDWVARLLLTVFASKEVFPMQFLHAQSVASELPSAETLADPALNALHADTRAGCDLFRLLVASAPEPGPDVVAVLRERYARLTEPLLEATHIARHAKPVQRLPSNLPVLDALFVEHFQTAAMEIARLYRRYRFHLAWRALDRLVEDLRDYARLVGFRGDGQARERRALCEGLLREWTLQYLKLVTPIVPVFAENLWKRGWNAPEGASIFLSEWPLPLDDSLPALKMPRRTERPDGTFAEWIRAARRLRAATGDSVEATTLYVDVPDRVPLYEELVAEMAFMVGHPVTISGVEPDAAGSRVVRLSTLSDSEGD